MFTRRPVERDARDYDTTSLHADVHGQHLHRDYSAHFFRWNFARRFIDKTTRVLEIGCGVEKPLAKILTKNAIQQVDTYVGVDLNPLTPGGAGNRATFFGEFNFVQRWRELMKHPGYPFDVIIHLEVIEHMKVDHGRKLLRACYELLKPGGLMLMSTPCYDGKRHAANHIHEYTVPELDACARKAGFIVERRFGTFMDTRHLKNAAKQTRSFVNGETGSVTLVTTDALKQVSEALGEYYDRDALSCIFAPLFPNQARNNLWVCRRPEKL